MNRSPLFYPLNRGMDADAGGAADLQTDVMRFMAIISMCLVAIFALVQSIPLAPVVDSSPEPATPEQPVDMQKTTEVPERSENFELTRPTPPKPIPAVEAVVLERPKRFTPPREVLAADVAADLAAEPAESPPATVQSFEPSSQSVETQKGFTLRFESDQALTRLVEQDVVGLYAITDDQTLRMNAAGSQYSFWSASAPTRFHEMDAGTVPEPVITAFQRRNTASSSARWGVSLPAGMSQSLNNYLGMHEGGALIIGLDGQLRLEQ